MKIISNLTEKIVVNLADINMKDVSLVGGKNASLGELIQSLAGKEIKVPGGFALTSVAYWDFINSNKLKEPIQSVINKLDRKYFKNIETISDAIRQLILCSTLPRNTIKLVRLQYLKMQEEYGKNCDVAVRSSATAEDLPNASFAGQHESYLNISGSTEILKAILHCYASLFSQRAIKYREDHGFDSLNIALSVGIQKMVRSDLACSGVCFTLEPESGFRDIIHISGSWGLGENIVKGTITPDEFLVFKKTLIAGKQAIINRKLGSKEYTMRYAVKVSQKTGSSVVNIVTPEKKRNQFILSDQEIINLAKCSLDIEKHYKRPMDIEWAKDGKTNQMYIVQARPETVHASKTINVHHIYTLREKGEPITSGIAIGNKIVSGKARILNSLSDANLFKEGEILVTEITNPDWNVIMKKSAAIITDNGGRTSHASIVARELGVPALIGCGNATSKIKNGQLITISCAEGQTGFAYSGILKWDEKEIDLKKIIIPKTNAMLILSNPEKAFELSFYPNNGVGLLRIEFIISNEIRIHPMALVNYQSLKDIKAKKLIGEITILYKDKAEYFIDKLSQAVATMAAAFYPKDVIVRMSDFKSNEYANLIGGKEFEPVEENPMIGFRGASRYYNERYKEGFRLECEAMKMVRDEMGFTNIKLMIPFCRTVDEGIQVVDIMKNFGLIRGKNNLEIYMMVEIPSNVLLADEFAKHFDGFSIGSNDLTQLTLGIDRDSTLISNLFDERNDAVKQLISLAIQKAKRNGRKIGLCGQAPSDISEYTDFLIDQGIDSISFTPDAFFKGIENINNAEKKRTIKKVSFVN